MSMDESISKQQGGLPPESCPGGSRRRAVDAAFPRVELSPLLIAS